MAGQAGLVYKAGGWRPAGGATVMGFDQFAAQRNAGMFAVDVATQRQPGASTKQRARQQRENARLIAENTKRRAAAKEEYSRMVASGTVRPPTRLESLISTARGHSDNPSVQAARRLLAKRGIKY